MVSAEPPIVRFLTPTYRPAGGVIKVFDYLVHALELGYRAAVHCPVALTDDEPLFTTPRFIELRGDQRVSFHETLSIGIGVEDWALFSWPPHYEQIARGMDSDTPHERAIHLVQNTRHANPAFADGYALRLLGRPLARIMVAHEVMDACLPHLNRSSMSATIVEGHDCGYFYRRRGGGLEKPLRVGYTTWKSDVGERVQREVGDRHSFRSIRRTASWAQVRELLHWCNVFLCCPGPEEGFYLPGLEALAAGALVITPDVGGNRAYCRFGENCLLVEFEQPASYIEALDVLDRESPDRITSIRERGYSTLEEHTLTRERSAFGSFLVELASKIRTDPRPRRVERTRSG